MTERTEEQSMNGYSIRIEVQDGKVKEIMDRLNEAQQTIYRCYQELQDLGVVVVKEKAASGNQTMQSGQPGNRRMTTGDVSKAADGPTLQEVMTHFGYETVGEWNNTWLNNPAQIERLASLPEFIRTIGLDKKQRIIFDYDPAYPKLLLQATASNSNQLHP